MMHAADFICPSCGWTHHDYAACGHFRCSACLTAALGPDIEPTSSYSCGTDESHPTELHRGTPSRLAADLRIGIQLAVKEKNYELAAVLRDTLQNLRKGLNCLQGNTHLAARKPIRICT